MQNEINGNILMIVIIDLQDQNKLCFAKWANFWAKFQGGKRFVYKTKNYKLEVSWVAAVLFWELTDPNFC